MSKFWMVGVCAVVLTGGQAWGQEFGGDAPVPETVVPESAPAAPAPATTATERPAQEAVIPTRGERAAPAPDKLNLALGLGVSNFRGALNNNLSAGPSWDVRAGFLNDNYVGGELAYSGSVNSVNDKDDDLGRNVGGTAMASAGDAQVRFNATTKNAWQPFAAAGVGMLGLNVRDEDTTVDRGTAFTIPLSAGLNLFTGRRMVWGARVNYRVLTDLVANDIPSGDQWDAGLNVGATF